MTSSKLNFSLSPLKKWFKNNQDLLLIWLLRIVAAIAGIIILLILFFLVLEALPVLQEVGIKAFFQDDSWNPSEQSYNLVPMIWGTVLTMTGSVIIATPLGIISAIFCQYYAPLPIASLYRRLIELLAGIPSVVYGFWGLVVLVPLINRIHPPGTSLLAGIAILTLMILPTITLVADASFAKVPSEYLLGAASLGLSSWGIIVHIVDPVRTLTANIALEMAYALDNHRSALFVSGLLLMMVIVVLAIAVEQLTVSSEQ